MISKTKKLLPFCPILMMLFGCGKKVENSTETEKRRLDLNLPETLSLEAEATGNFNRVDGLVSIPRDGDIRLPLTLPSSGTTGNFEAKLALNILEGEEEFECSWKGQGDSYKFVACQDPDGRDLGLTPDNLSTFTFPIDQGKTIRLRLTAAPTGTTVKVQAQLPVSWK